MSPCATTQVMLSSACSWRGASSSVSSSARFGNAARLAAHKSLSTSGEVARDVIRNWASSSSGVARLESKFDIGARSAA